MNINYRRFGLIILILTFICLLFIKTANAEELKMIKSTMNTETGYINYNHPEGYKYVYAFSNGNAATKKYAVVYSREKITGQTYQGIIENNDCYIALFKTYDELNKAVFETRIPKFDELDIKYNTEETFTLYQNIFSPNEISPGYSGAVHGDNTITSKTFENYFKELNIKQSRLDNIHVLDYSLVFNELFSVLGITISVLITYLAVRKGIKFISEMLRGA